MGLRVVRVVAAWLIFTSLLCVSPVRADEVHSCVVDASDVEVARRLEWIEGRLNQGQYGAVAWWGGWMAYAAGEMAFGWWKFKQTDDRLEKDIWLVTGVGSTLWIAQMLLFPMQPAYAPRQMRRLPNATAGERRTSLAKAEHILREAAETEREGLHWAEHALDTAWAVGSTAYIFGRSYGHTSNKRLWRESAIELVLTEIITEAAILSTPRQAIRDLEKYEKEPCEKDRPGALVARIKPERERPWKLDVGVTGLGFRLQF